MEDLSTSLANLGSITSHLYKMRQDLSLAEAIPELSLSSGTVPMTEADFNYARGYTFNASRPIKVRSIQFQWNFLGQVTAFVFNDKNKIVHTGTCISNDTTMKSLTITLSYELKDKYSLFLWAPSGNGSFAYKAGNCGIRAINQSFSVRSRCITSVGKIEIGATVTLTDNNYALEMLLEI